MHYLESNAKISPDGLYRYWLSRRVGMGERTLLVVGTNPSRADWKLDDPTIRRCVGFTIAIKFDWLLMGNLQAYRSPDPKVLRDLDDLEAVGPGNQEALNWMTQRAELIIAAWGSAPLTPYAAKLGEWILSLPHTRCFGVNRDGRPKHPLYLPKDAKLEKVVP